MSTVKNFNPIQNQNQEKNEKDFFNTFKDPVFAFELINDTCVKMCVEDIRNPVFQPAQISCLNRCVVKYRQAISFGMNSIQHFNILAEKKKMDKVSQGATKGITDLFSDLFNHPKKEE